MKIFTESYSMWPMRAVVGTTLCFEWRDLKNKTQTAKLTFLQGTDPIEAAERLRKLAKIIEEKATK